MSKPNERIPFEPNNRNKKSKEAKKPSIAPVAVKKSSADTKPTGKRSNSLGIPDEVNRRIIRRAALFCGIPTGLGLATFFVSYILVSKHIIDLPTSAVVLVSMLFLGIGVAGLSYGAISASWDEGRVGSWWGGEEFKKNFGYLTEAWKSQQQIARASQKPPNK
ncbi:PAM68 family protein [Pseudanabaena mucicola]|uniref:PAM68 family protein n=1 Tax=Pseudanabaena mucicola FACHB-723 TaxID=2692860 RepID=A0ABR7ZWR2_9CYAN|nr:photosystem II biosynthesis protein [Pseudanabaena mucicola]MBD2187974.1 PAM68 family protein [Pseudanabaena mucicola FACHB-723]